MTHDEVQKLDGYQGRCAAVDVVPDEVVKMKLLLLLGLYSVWFMAISTFQEIKNKMDYF